MAERLTGAAITKYLGITPLINAGGPNTRHSGSRPRPEAIRAMEAMSEVFVQIDELLIAAGERIAELTGNEAATITSGASGGLVVQAAAAMAKDNHRWHAARTDHPAGTSVYVRSPLPGRGCQVC